MPNFPVPSPTLFGERIPTDSDWTLQPDNTRTLTYGGVIYTQTPTGRMFVQFRTGGPATVVRSIAEVAALQHSTAVVPRPSGNRVIAIGDSITKGDRTSDNAGGPPSTNTGYDPLWWAQFLSDQAILYFRNAGVGGDTSAGVLARLHPDVIAYSPAVAVVSVGTNDIASSVSLASYASNISEIVQELRRVGIIPVLGTIPPRNDTTSAEDTLNKLTEQYNFWLRMFASRAGISLVDYHKVLVNPVTGGFVKDNFADGVHPNSVGAIKMGQALSDVLKPILRAPGYGLLASNLEASTNNLLLNGLFTDDANADGLADNWTNALGAGHTPSLVVDGTILGNWQRITAAAVSSGANIFQTIPVGGWSAGEELRISGLLAWDSPVGTSGAHNQGKVSLIRNGAEITVITPTVSTTVVAGGAAPASAMSKHEFVYEYVVPAGTTSLTLYFGRTSGTAVGGWAQISQLSVINLSRLGIPRRLA